MFSAPVPSPTGPQLIANVSDNQDILGTLENQRSRLPKTTNTPDNSMSPIAKNMNEPVLYPATPPPEFFDNPYPFFHRLRNADPVHWSEPVGAWILTRYEDVSLALFDSRFSAQRIPALMNQMPQDIRKELTPLTEHLSNWMVSASPPDHKRLRGLLIKTFTPRMIESMRPGIQDSVNRLLDRVETRGGMDVIRDFAHPLPFTVICELFGLPDEYYAQLKQTADDLLNFFATSRAQADRAAVAQKSIGEMRNCLREVIRQRRRDPRSDLISYLVGIEDEEERITETELVATVVFFLFAGHETTTDLIGNGLLALLQHPDQLQKLRDDVPGRITGAIEEMLRYESPIQRLWRIATEQIELNGQHIESGQIVMCMLGAANRDPARFERPDEFDITRKDNRHLAFGQGVHYCIGAALARLEGQIAFQTLLSRFPTIQLTGEVIKRKHNLAHRRLEWLPVQFR